MPTDAQESIIGHCEHGIRVHLDSMGNSSSALMLTLGSAGLVKGGKYTYFNDEDAVVREDLASPLVFNKDGSFSN